MKDWFINMLKIRKDEYKFFRVLDMANKEYALINIKHVGAIQYGVKQIDVRSGKELIMNFKLANVFVSGALVLIRETDAIRLENLMTKGHKVWT